MKVFLKCERKYYMKIKGALKEIRTLKLNFSLIATNPNCNDGIKYIKSLRNQFISGLLRERIIEKYDIHHTLRILDATGPYYDYTYREYNDKGLITHGSTCDDGFYSTNDYKYEYDERGRVVSRRWYDGEDEDVESEVEYDDVNNTYTMKWYGYCAPLSKNGLKGIYTYKFGEGRTSFDNRAHRDTLLSSTRFYY